jgi:hypothetical protein
MKRIINYHIGKAAGALLAGALGLCAPSCNSYLNVDEYFLETTQLDSVFQRKELLIQYIRGAASYLPNEGNLFTSSPNPFGLASDECFTSWNDDRHAGMKYLLDEITPFSGDFNNYPRYYQGIRKANLVLSRINEVSDLTTDDLRDYMGLCYFLKGYYTYLLLLQYGPVPIVPNEPFAVNADVETLSLERNTYDECVEYICKNMELAHEFLLHERSLTEANMPDYGVPLAVMSRILLYAASPQYNGNSTLYGDWTKKDGTPFINPTPDNSKWGRAAAAAKRVMELEGGNKYELLWAMKENGSYDFDSTVAKNSSATISIDDPNFRKSFPEGAAGIDPFKSYTYIFNGEAPRALNKEIIYSCTPATQGDSPLWIASPKQTAGGNGLNLTQDMVDAYRMADGKDINESPLYPIGADAYATGTALTFSDYTLHANVVKMFRNREPRFYATVGFNYAHWPGTSYTGSTSGYVDLYITYYTNGTAGNSIDYPEDYNRSGYTCKKYIHPEDNMRQTASVRPKIYPIFRYAEILLNYVEALNELDAAYTDTVSGIMVTPGNIAEILKYFNMIRYRGGIPGVVTYPGRDAMRRLIKQERQVEFMCEGRRYHDLRRWGEDAISAYNKPIRGMNVKAKTTDPAASFYSPIVISSVLTRRSFQHKNYFCPIPRSAINKNANLVQNPGW